MNNNRRGAVVAPPRAAASDVVTTLNEILGDGATRDAGAAVVLRPERAYIYALAGVDIRRKIGAPLRSVVASSYSLPVGETAR